MSGTGRLESISGEDTVNYTYDANGNTTGIGSRTLVYNQTNRLIRVEDNGVTLGKYTYNALGQRVIKEVDGVNTVFHYDFDGLLIGESGSNGIFTTEYLYQTGKLLAKVDVPGNTVYHYLNDYLGSPKALTDDTNKAVWEATYLPFGKAVVNPASSVVNNMRFPGQYYDQETELHWNWHRYYDPSTGRYLTTDPIGLAGGINLYAYVQNNPINFFDPLGLYLTSLQQLKVSFASGIGSAVGGLLWGTPGSTAGGAVGGFITTLFMEGHTWQDVANSTLAGGLAGLTGSGIANLIEGTMMQSMKAAATTGAISGMIDSLLMGGNPVFKQSDTADPCK